MKKKDFLLVFIFLLPLSLLVFVAWKVFNYTYAAFVSYLAMVLHKPEWEKFIRLRFTENAFHITRWIIVFLSLAYILLGIFLYRKRRSFLNILATVIRSGAGKIARAKKEFIELPLYAKWIFIILLFIVAAKGLWYIIYWPLQYDEAWTYNYYIGNSFWQSFLLPHNNHIFFTLSAWFFHLLPFDPQISMRLPNLFAGLMLIILFFFFIKRHVSLNAALFSTGWLATCCPVVFYMLYARGYLFVLLFALIVFWLQWMLIRGKRNNFYKYLLFISIVLGYWSNPVFLYPHAAIVFAMVISFAGNKEWKNLWKNISIHALPLFIVTILYLPTLLSSHIHDLVNTGVRNTFSPDIWWLSVYYNSDFAFGIKKGYFLLFGVLALFIFYLLRTKRISFLNRFVLSTFLVILFFSFLQSIPLAGHITIFFSLAVAVMLAFVYENAEKSWWANKIVLSILLTGTIIMNSYLAHRHRWFNWSVEYDQNAKTLSAEMMKKNIQSCYLTVNYYKPHLEYYYKTKGKKLDIAMPDPASQDFHLFDPKAQQSVILRNNKLSSLDLQQYRIFFRDETITAYLRKDVNPQ